MSVVPSPVEIERLANNLHYMMRVRLVPSELELAVRAKIPKSTLYRLLRREVAQPSIGTLMALGKFFDIPWWSLVAVDLEAVEMDRLSTAAINDFLTTGSTEATKWHYINVQRERLDTVLKEVLGYMVTRPDLLADSATWNRLAETITDRYMAEMLSEGGEEHAEAAMAFHSQRVG